MRQPFNFAGKLGGRPDAQVLIQLNTPATETPSLIVFGTFAKEDHYGR